MSGSSNALLDSLAHPAGINILADYGGAADAANKIWQTRAWQAKQAAGQNFLNSINPDGTPNQQALLQGAKNTPGMALVAQPSAQAGQTLSADTQNQNLQLRSTVNQMLPSVLKLPDSQLHDGVVQGFLQLENMGLMTHERSLQIQGGLPPDGPSLRTALTNIQTSNQGPIQQQQTTAGIGGTMTAPGGRTVGTVTDPNNPGVISSPAQPGVQTGPDAATLSGVSTITNPDGSTTTDTLAGHQKAGRVTPLGDLAPGYSAATASPAMVTALRGQEGTPNGQTSVAGARGQMQVTPGFFKQYAQPGESFDSKADVETVAKRGIAALEAKYPNDPGRVATAYFSGEDNVAPPGSATPYKADLKDANGASTSAYVAGATTRYKAASAAQPPTAAPKTTGGGTTIAPQLATQQAADVKSYHDQTAAYNNSDANLIANYKEAYSLGQKIATGRGLTNLADIRSGIVSLGRAVGIDTGTMDTNDQARAELDKVLNQILISQPSAGRSDASLGTTAGATPHLGMNTNAMLNQIRILYGQTKQQNAAMLESDPAVKGVGFEAAHRTMMSGTARDGFAADLMTPDEIDARVKSLGADTSAGMAFKRAVNKNMSIYKAAPGSGLQ